MNVLMALDDVTATHLRWALSEWRVRCRTNGVAFPASLMSLNAALAASGGQVRPVMELDGGVPEGDPMVVAVKYDEAAVRLQVSARTVRRLVARGDLPTVDIGGCKRVRTADLITFLEALPVANAPSQMEKA